MSRASEDETKLRILLLAPATSYRITDFLDAARGLDVAVTVGSDQRQALEALSGGATMTIDLADPERGVSRIIEYHRDRPFAAIIAVDEEATIIAAAASEALGLPHNAPEAVAAAGNKHVMRTALRDAGLSVPGFFVAALDDGVEAALREASYPCVLKPLTLSASRGVIRADDDAAFEAAFHRIAAILRPASDHILIEDYIPGAEVALEALIDDGHLRTLALFDKPDPLEGPFFEETIYVTPSRLADAVQRAISDTAAAAAAALGLRDGPIHAELRLPPGEPVVIDIAARSIGGLCARALKFGAGIGLEELILRHALHMPIEVAERERRASGVMMLPIPRAGILRRVGGQDVARAVPGIDEVAITIPIGQEVVPLPEGNRYLGFVFARGESPEFVEHALREAHRRLDMEIVP
jgi:biotin carboxylase